jgi:hypothetical protein
MLTTRGHREANGLSRINQGPGNLVLVVGCQQVLKVFERNVAQVRG